MTKFAVVTGGSSGIGRHLVAALAKNGFVVGFSHLGQEAEAKSLEEEMAADGLAARGWNCDVGRGDEVASFFAHLHDWFGTAPDVLINNAGIQTWSSLLDLSEDRWDQVLQTNLKGCFLNTQAAARQMVAAGKGGSIINIGSGCNKIAFPNLVDYTASKGGVEQLTKVSAVELGPHGIRVNCVAPGAIANERTEQEAAGYSEKWAAITPLQRVGTAEDIAGPVLFLTSPASEFVTGQTIWVDGGAFTQANWPQY